MVNFCSILYLKTVVIDDVRNNKHLAPNNINISEKNNKHCYNVLLKTGNLERLSLSIKTTKTKALNNNNYIWDHTDYLSLFRVVSLSCHFN